MAALAAALVLTSCGSGAQSSAPVPSGPPTDDLRVGLLEFRLALSAGTLAPGPVIITATNAGSTGHDLRLRQGDSILGSTSVLSPGGQEVLRVDVQPGEPVRLDCTVGGHAEAGMHATLTVAGEVPPSTAPFVAAPPRVPVMSQRRPGRASGVTETERPDPALLVAGLSMTGMTAGEPHVGESSTW